MAEELVDPIIDPETWRAVQAKIAAVTRQYTRTSDGAPEGRAVVRDRQGRYLLSGLLFCGACGAPMTIHGRTTNTTYRCTDHCKRGTCANALPVTERVARERIVEAVRERLLSPGGLAYARRRIAERLGELARTRNAEVDERVKRLQRTEARIGGLIQFISDGDQSAYVRTTLLDLKAQARAEKAAIAAIEHEARQPVHLPSPAEQLALDVTARLDQDPLAGREVLRRLLQNGRIVLEPQPDGVYLARTAVLPLVLLAERDLRNPGELPGLRCPDSVAGARYPYLPHPSWLLTVDVRVPLAPARAA